MAQLILARLMYLPRILLFFFFNQEYFYTCLILVNNYCRRKYATSTSETAAVGTVIFQAPPNCVSPIFTR